MFKKLAAVFLLIPYIISAQSNPSYSERKSFFFSDSTGSSSQSFEQYTEGKINEEVFLVGPGDKFQLSIQGIDDYTQLLFVNVEGQIYIPKVGGVSLSGLTLKAAKQKILQLINSRLKNVNIFLSLVEPRRIKVYCTGDVKKSLAHIVFATSRLSDIMQRSEILNPTADLRNIQITHNDGSVHSYDFLQFLRNGNSEQNPYLIEGDVIKFQKVDKCVLVLGAVKFPALYEYRANEELKSLMQLVGGLTSKAKTDSIEIIRFSKDERTQSVLYVSLSDLTGSTMLQPFDKIVIREKSLVFLDNAVQIDGYVRFPGPYLIEDNKTKLSDVIKKAGGFLPTASLNDASVRRESGIEEIDQEFERIRQIPRQDMTDDEYDYLKSKSRLRRGKVVVDFHQLFEQNNTSEDIYLRRGDIITIPEQKNYISLIGQVVNPGKIEIRKTWKIKDYITAAGGFGWRAQESEIRVVRATSGEWVEADDVKELFPGDVIWVPEDPPAPKFWDITTRILTVLGQVATVVAATVAVVVSTSK